MVPVEIFLHDPLRTPMPNAPYQLTCEGRVYQGSADGNGKLQVKLCEGALFCTVRWRHQSTNDLPPDQYEYERKIYLELPSASDDKGRNRRLHNLGLPGKEDPVLAFGLFKEGWGEEGQDSPDEAAIATLDEIVHAPLAADDDDAAGADDDAQRT
jgi:hypothetical protein